VTKRDVNSNTDTKNMTLYENYERRMVRNVMLVKKMFSCDQKCVKITDNGIAYISFGSDNY
jgi:hypothetical protein